MSTVPAADERSLSLFAPPYNALHPCGPDVLLDLADVENWKGCALVWQLTGSIQHETVSAALARRSQVLPLLILLPPPAEIQAILQLLPVVRALTPRLILPFGVIDAPLRLRQVLALPPRSLSAAVTQHLIRRGLLNQPNTIRCFQRIFELAPDTHSIAHLARRMYTSRRTLGRHFKSTHLPVPSHCLHFARLLNVALRLQADNTASYQIATRLGYPDGFTMSNQMKRLIGHRPSEVRGLLGWEWIVEVWLKQEGLV
jgi:AraC-like DNA-binding protein